MKPDFFSLMVGILMHEGRSRFCHFGYFLNYISTRVSQTFSQHVIFRQYFMFHPPVIQRIHIKKKFPYLRVSNMSFSGIWNAYSVFHFSATEPANPPVPPICLKDARPQWQIILPMKFSIFCYFFFPYGLHPFPTYFYHIDL